MAATMTAVLRQRPALLLVVVALATSAAACGARAPAVPTAPSAPTPTVLVMGAFTLSPHQLVAWFSGRQPQPPGVYAATEPVEMLAQYYIEEGAAEGVTGDVAFMQGIVETGWFRFAGSVPAWKNNFAGIGATDAGSDAATFPDARTGVRAQIQHLRAYADPGAYACSVPPLHNPCVDPRFNLVVPKGRATTWNQMGNGNWATSSTYATTILDRYFEALTFSGLR